VSGSSLTQGFVVLSFGLSGIELLLALVRGLFVASVLSILGASLFLNAVAPPIWPRLHDCSASLIQGRCRCVVWGSLLAASVAGLVWLVLEAGVIADAETTGQTLAAVPSVLFDTRFGQVLAAQALALFGVGAATATHRQVGALAATSIAGVATLLEAGHSHAFAMAHGLSALLLSQALHMLAAGAWLGGLLPLLQVVRGVPLDVAALATRRFSTLGLASVTILAATAMFQGWILSGGLPGLVGTAYGAVLLIKATLFTALIALAAFNRFRLTPALAAPHGEQSRKALIRSIGTETILGLCVVLAAGVLSSLEPGMHQV
jgi:putative copper resistance protein D